MRIDVQSKSKSLLGVTDLTLAATIKPGLIPAMDTRTYESRLRLLFRTLNTLRVSSKEVNPTPLIADAVDRIRAIHSFRLAIVGDETRRLLLSVVFDGGWEPYMRRIWRDLGPLLDVIFCNCEGYLDSYSHDFPAYANWVRSAQVDTEFFYNASGLTVSDLHYLRNRVATDLRGKAGAPSEHGTAQEPSPEDVAAQGLPALVALYRLSDMYPPTFGTDGQILQRAARHLLGESGAILRAAKAKNGYSATEQAALDWFVAEDGREPSPEKGKTFDIRNVQGGIVKAYEATTHACLLLIRLKDAQAAKVLIDRLKIPLAESALRAAEGKSATKDRPFVNLGLTFQGLKLAGVADGNLELLPQEFREGMAARASILGDFIGNHPICWRLPKQNWPNPRGTAAVELSSVHAVVQFTCGDEAEGWQDIGDKNHPLRAAVESFGDTVSAAGIQILSVQCMRRYLAADKSHSRSHFDFVDGMSQPLLGVAQEGTPTDPDVIKPGDLLLGYENSLGDPELTGTLWDDSTFQVVRKLEQDVDSLAKVLAKTDDPERTRERFMGRTGDGRNLFEDRSDKERIGNAFTYVGDLEGRFCPFQAHVRRANPRDKTRADIRTVPRIMRRGMSYGPRIEDDPDRQHPRGLFFMAYNVSIAEQFEVIQAWLSGGNSSALDTYSALRDPFVGIPLEGDPHRFIFADKDGKPTIVELPADKPIVTLDWGIYLFVPSIKAIGELADLARMAAEGERDWGKSGPKNDKRRKAQLIEYTLRGGAVIARLQRAEQLLGFDAARDRWKIALEDLSARMGGVSRDVWAAIRALHGGALRTPYGVLVCSKTLVQEVFDNKDKRYTVSGYAERMRRSFGEIYLGLDDGTTYRADSCDANRAIMSITCDEAFEIASEQTKSALEILLAGRACAKLEVKDIVDKVLSTLSRYWFGIPDDCLLVEGGWHWRPDDKPTCPGHFHSPSRYMFQPNPGDEASLVGQQHGKALQIAVASLLASSSQDMGTIGNVLRDAYAEDPGHRASTLVGVMMGFLPTVDGNVRGVLYEWVSDRSLWDLQLDYLAEKTSALQKAKNVLAKPLIRTLLLRPVPEIVWRTAVEAHSLGPVEVRAGDRIVVSIVSATQESLYDETDCIDFIFGGNRQGETHPTHACPGYKMAMGVMLGMLASLLEHAHLTPTLSPMELEVRMRKG